VLIGGLGMGYTLRAALDTVGPDARITVAELVEAVGEWNAPGGPLADLCGCPVADARTVVAPVDVCDLIRQGEGRYDAILIDTDNETTALCSGGNGFLYTADGLQAARRALRPGGVLAFWFLRVGKGFLAMLGREGFSVTSHDIASGEGTSRHAVIVAQAPAA
jgi:spermidine synthase